jgi:preprotein translocase subunit SecE
MTPNTEAEGKRNLDWLIWLLVVVLIIAGLVANNHYNTQPWPLRLLSWLVLLMVLAAVALQTRAGKHVLSFARESRMELRKVFWPTRQETMQMTLVVALAVLVLAGVLWLIDSGLMWLIGWLTGQRG